jgi:CRP-like cAMP-binding protein
MSDFTSQGLRRMLLLRQFHPLEHVDLDELATVAENLVETTVPAGTVITTAGSRLRQILLILDGHVETQPNAYTWGPHQVFGALEVFANREARHTVVATSTLRALQLSAGDLGELLEDNFGVLLASLRELAMRLLAQGMPRRRCAFPAFESALGLVDRLIVLRQQLPFASARLQALATLAHASDEITWPAHTTIVRTGDAATSGFIVTSGNLIATRDQVDEPLGPGASFGYLEALAGVQHGATLETTGPVRALRSQSSALLDVIEDHTDVGLAMLAAFAQALLDGSGAISAPSTTSIAA